MILIFLLALFFLFSPSFSLPTTVKDRKDSLPHTNFDRGSPNDTPRRLDNASGEDLIKLAAIIGTADLSTKLIDETEGQQIEMEEKWITQTVNSLADQFPSDNVLIYHDTASTADDFTDSVYSHYDVDVFPFWKKSYEIWVFKTGKFARANDGGVRNWYFAGCWQRTDDAHVEFAARDNCPFY
ncbi:hypothetical protein QBC39DRAFT_91480 [Podospora conica]|nr:hypothetical protein QBC39DRAFT_91480 [Schizothecium conicum]